MKIATTLLIVLCISGSALSQSLTVFKTEGKRGLKNEKGDTLIKPVYDYVYGFANGVIAVNLGGHRYDEGVNADGGKWGFFDYSGRQLTPLKYDNARPLWNSNANRYVAVNKGCKSKPDYCNGGKWGLMDSTGKEVVPLKYDVIQAELVAHETPVAYVQVKGKFGFLDATTAKEITPIKYDEVRLFRWSEEAAFRVGKKWGLVDNTGKELIPPRFDESFYYDNGKAKVKLDGREMYIDKLGNEVK